MTPRCVARVVSDRAGLDAAIAHGMEYLNVAGPRESEQPGVPRRTYDLLEAVLRATSPSSARG